MVIYDLFFFSQIFFWMTTIFPIREISTYNGKNWTIKARVTSKSQIRTFANDRGNGKVFSVDLLDKDGGEIKASFFNSSCDKFYPDLEVGNIYTMSRGNVKVANKRYSSSKHNYEINFDADAVIALSVDDNTIDSVKFSFVKIREVTSKAVPCTIDLLGVVKEVKSIGKVQSKNGSGEELSKRTIVVVDDSECAMEITLWQDAALKYDETVLGGRPIVAIKGLSVREYNGARSASTTQQAVIEIVTPESNVGSTDAGKQVLSWWSNTPNIAEYFNISHVTGGEAGAATPGVEGRGTQSITSLSDMKEECKRGFFGDKGIYFDCIGKLAYVSTKIKDTDIAIYYSACPSCNRKLSEDGTNRCFACDKTVAKPSVRFLFRGQFIDHSDQGFLTVFDAQGSQILKRSAEDLIAAASNGSNIPDELKKAYFEKPYHLRVKAVGQEYKGEVKPKITVISAEPIEFVSMGKRLLKKLIQKIGVEKVQVETTAIEKEKVDEATVEAAPVGTTTPNVQDEVDSDEPDNKKMRMEFDHSVPPMVESKE
jgi:replication factor A1